MESNSIFYTSRYGRSFAVPMLAYEYMGVEFSKEGVAEDEEKIGEVYRTALEEICKVKFNKDTLQELVSRAQGTMSEASGGEGKSNKPPKKGFTSTFYKYFLDLPADKLLLQVCGNDYKVAEHLYCVLDRDDTMEVIAGYTARLQQDHGVMLEACAFGFGGEASGGGGGVVELDPADEEAVKQTFKGLF